MDAFISVILSCDFFALNLQFKRDVRLTVNVLKGVHVKMNLTSSFRDGELFPCYELN